MSTFTPPFAANTEATATPTAAPTAAPAVTETTVAPKEKKESKPRSEVMISDEHIKFVKDNVKTMGYKEMAEHLGISKNQVNRILQELKKMLRDIAIERSKPAEAYAQNGVNKKGGIKWDYNTPLTDIAKKVEDKIDNTLSRPEDARPGAGKGGQVSAALKSGVDDILSEIGL